MSLTKHEAHLATGMKVSEILDIQETDDGYRVTTHDGQHIDLEESAEPELTLSESVQENEFALSLRGPENPAGVPSGTEKDVLEWVGEDRDRAQAALELEQSRETPRKGLAEKLQKLAG